MHALGTSQRKDVRLKIPENDSLVVDVNGENFIDRFQVTDISTNGVGIKVSHNFEGCKIDKLVDFILTIPARNGRAMIKTKGKIRHVTDHYFGLSFIDITEDDRERINHYISDQLQSGKGGIIEGDKSSSWQPKFLHKMNALFSSKH